ncbi:MAG TPA: hypothetical protein DIT99_28370 [Candidatus Latescibacteria bacterium]|nr:hypothetical protein [Candidatus Latescibacterota bacterium]
MKYIFIISTIIIFLATFILNNYHQKNKAEVVISVNNLNSSNIINSLKEDFNKNHLPRLNKKLAKEDRIATGL